MNKIVLASMMLVLVSASAAFAENETANETEPFNDSIPLNDSDLFDNSTLLNDTEEFNNETVIGNSTDFNDTIIDNSTSMNDTVIDNSTITNETVADNSTRDIEILSSNPGVVLRFSQLYRQIEIKIDQANDLISQVNDSGVAEQLSAIITALESVKEQASYYTNPDMEYDLSQAAVDFVYLKKQSIDLVKEFREISHDYFKNEATLAMLRNRIQVWTQKRSQIDEKIANMTRKYNALKVKSMFGELDNETVAGIMNGSIPKNQINAVIRNRIENLTDQVKQRVMMNIKENLVKNNINASARKSQAIENAENISQRIRNTVQERIKEYKDQNPNSSLSLKQAVKGANSNKGGK